MYISFQVLKNVIVFVINWKYRIYKITYFEQRAGSYLQRNAGIVALKKTESQTTIFAAPVVGAKHIPECSVLVTVFSMGKEASAKKNMVTFLIVPHNFLYCRITTMCKNMQA